MLSFYEILNVPQDASFELIKSSYQSKALFLHPDKTGSETSSISFVQLQEAWDVLRDPFKRKLYDKSLKVALEKNELPLFEDVDLDEMEYNEKEASYFKACRCGGEGFKVFETQLEEGIEKFTCGSCSFMILKEPRF